MRVLAPLLSGSTYRRGVHLLLGAVLLLPYALLAGAFTQMLRSDTPRVLTLVLLAATAVIACVPAFLRGTRMLEIAAARALLGVDLPDPAGHAQALEARLRCALWFATHLVAGGVVATAALFAVPPALAFIAARLGIGTEELHGFEVGPLDGDDTVWLSLIGLAILVALAYAVAGLGALAATMAPVLLGPSTAERIAGYEAEAEQLAERNRLARELHDSVGHALTVTTLQAAAAREVLDSDPEFVRRALTAVEEAGRAAMADLDHVLGLLRQGERAGVAPQRTLAELDRLVADARAAGAEVDLQITGTLAGMPAAVSRTAYRVVQEGLTNAARHAAGEPLTLRLTATDDLLRIEIVNPAPGAPAAPAGGRGLAGMRERVDLLGGWMAAGRDGDAWRVAVRLPLGGRWLREAAG